MCDNNIDFINIIIQKIKIITFGSIYISTYYYKIEDGSINELKTMKLNENNEYTDKDNHSYLIPARDISKNYHYSRDCAYRTILSRLWYKFVKFTIQFAVKFP